MVVGRWGGRTHLVWTSGEDAVKTFMLYGEPSFPTAFCTTCGSSLPSLSSTGRFWVVPAGTVDGDPGVEPTRNIFWGSRAPWLRDVGSLPVHDELPSG